VLHVGLAHKAELVVIAPATANTLAKLVHGLADNLLTLSALAADCPIIIAPAMDGGMYSHSATQDNLEQLDRRGVIQVGPAEGHLASGIEGVGRMVEPLELLGHIRLELSRGGLLKGCKVIVTAGGTQEPIDPVRMITNRSSGKQGYALAQAALDLGGEVTLISTPTHLDPPIGAKKIAVRTAHEMLDAVLESVHEADILIMAAAVADFRPAAPKEQKFKKQTGTPHIEIEPTADILDQVAKQKAKSGRPKVTIGFAAESQDLLENAHTKLMDKKLDLIVANDITAHDSGFGVDMNRVTLMDNKGLVETLPLLSKAEVAAKVMDRAVELLQEDIIVHVCQHKDWQTAVASGIYRAASLSNEGFIHCSRPEQVLKVVNTFYSDLPNLVLLWIDPKVVQAETRWEIVDGEEFPHIYGPLNINAVIAVGDLVPDDDGIYNSLPPLDYFSINSSNNPAI
jgi:phosphopantothenoylcysteine decarboxylase/phosphopantothenate--cysteine ligase